jgi:hypothetical protein
MSNRLPLTRLPQRHESHPCPHPDCARTLPALIWACDEHWQALPPTIRQGIWAASRGAGPQSLQLDRAEQAAFAFWGSIERGLRELSTPPAHAHG